MAVDLLHVDTVGVRRIYALIFIEHGTRRAHLGGVTAYPTGPWVTQRAGELMMSKPAEGKKWRFLLRDRGTNFIPSFGNVFQDEGMAVLLSPPGAPKANSICERIIGSARREAHPR